MQRWLTALVMVAVVPALRAQVALCAQYGGTFLSGNNSGDGNVVRGVTLGAYFARSHAAFFSFGVDARGTHQTSTDGVTQLTGGLIGPRLAFRTPVLGFKPYVEALGGAAHVEYIKSNEGVSTTNFQYQLLGGADLTVLPHIDWRVLEFGYGGIFTPGDVLQPKPISTGVVLRF
jgi:hypothetical protein